MKITGFETIPIRGRTMIKEIANVLLFPKTEGSAMRLFVCFFFVFSVLCSPTPAFSEDCGCSGQTPELEDNLLEAQETWKAQQVWERPSKVAFNVSAIILSDFGYPTSRRVLLAPLSAAHAMRDNLLEEITRNSISTLSKEEEEIKKFIIERGKEYIESHEMRSLMCQQFTSPNFASARKFAETIKLRHIPLEKVFLNLKCPIRYGDYSLCQNSDIPDDEKRDAFALPLCGDIFLLASFYSDSARALSTIIKSLMEQDSKDRFLPKILQCKRLTRTFYNKKTNRMETRCLPLVDIVENSLYYRSRNRRSMEAFAKVRRAFKMDYFNLMPDESPPTKEFCQKYATLSCHEDLPDSNAW